MKNSKVTKPLLYPVVEKAKANEYFRKVFYTSKFLQCALMTLTPGEEIDPEIHEHADQAFLIVSGRGVATLGTSRRKLEKWDLMLVPPKIKHSIKNTGKAPLKIFTWYTPPQHRDGTIHRTKEDAEEDTKDYAFGHDK